MKNRLMQLRKEQRLTIKQLSELLKSNKHIISTNELAQYEHNEKEITINNLVILSDFFQVPALFLNGESDIKDSEVIFDVNAMFRYFKEKNGLHQGNIFIDDQEIYNISLEKHIQRYKIFKELFIIQGRNIIDEESKKYEEILNNVAQSNLIDIDDIFFDLDTLFKMFLKSHTGDKKAINDRRKISKIINSYSGIDEY